MKMKSTVLGLIAGLSLLSTANTSNAQILNVASLVPTDIISPVITQVTDLGLPLAIGLVTSPLSQPVFSGFEQVKPLMAQLLDGNNFDPLTALYGPLDTILIPLSDVILIP